MISVIVCTYNQEHTIARTLDSILAQQCSEPVEIMLSDDASNDGTPAICQAYAQRFPERIVLNLNKQNKGLIDNYFDTVLAAHGDLIADLAGDDEWCDPLKLEKELRVMRQQPDVTLVHTAWNYRQEATGQVTSPTPLPMLAAEAGNREMLENIVTQTSRPVINLCTALYRKEVFLEEYAAHPDLFRTKNYGCEDMQLTFVMALHGRIAYLPDVTLLYAIADGSISNNHANHSKQFHFVKQVTSLSFRLVTLYNLRSATTRRYFSHRVFELLMFAFRKGDREMRREAIKLQRTWHAPDTLKTRLVKAATSCTPCWKVALLLRRAVVALRRRNA